MAALDFSQRTEFESYVYNKEHTVDVLVTLKAAKSVAKAARAQLCLSACIDRSGSMRGDKLKLVKRTLQFVVRQLSDSDKLGVVTYESAVDVALVMKEMTEAGKQIADTAVERVRDGGSTNLSGGLFKSIEQIRGALEKDDHGDPGPVHAVLLLTDGLANVGIRDSATLKRTLEQTLRQGPPIKVHTFGYGFDHDGNLLKEVADVSEGNYYFIEKEDDVPTYFADALGGLASVVVQNMALKIRSAQPNVRIEKVFTGMKMAHNGGNKYKIQASDLYSEERKDILVRLKIPALNAPVEADALLNVKLSYFDIPAARSVNTEAIVCVKRPGIVPEKQVAEQDFIDQRLRIDVGVALMDAASMVRGGNYVAARGIVQRQRRACAFASKSDYTTFAVEELNEAEKLCGEDAAPVHANKLLSDCQSHTTQRSKSAFRSHAQTELVEKAVKGTVRQSSVGQQQLVPPQEEKTEESAPAARLSRFFSAFRSSSKRKSASEDNYSTKK